MYLRKLIHLSMGFFALTLKWMTPWQALLCALIAFAHNVFIFPLYGRKKIEKDEEVKKGYTGITSYPAVVFFLILFSFVFNSARVNSLTIAAMAWAVLAFGDSLSALTGMAIKGSKLPWNKNKTVAGFVAFIVFGAVASYLMAVYFNNDFYSNNYLISIILLSSVIAGIVESIDGQFDDNLGFPFVAFSILSFIIYPSLNKDDLYFSHLQSSEISEWFYFVLAFLFNIILAFTALKKKWVSMQGFLFGMLIGFSVIISLGYKGFLVLCLFYIFANFSTFYKSKIKEDRG
ncbi:MAG: DUF92 domain-containing protein, partial [Acidobacteria bacterium]|nr:DUF92 domain-containing protein [Acidobacteriota bacterium]